MSIFLVGFDNNDIMLESIVKQVEINHQGYMEIYLTDIQHIMENQNVFFLNHDYYLPVFVHVQNRNILYLDTMVCTDLKSYLKQHRLKKSEAIRLLESVGKTMRDMMKYVALFHIQEVMLNTQNQQIYLAVLPISVSDYDVNLASKIFVSEFIQEATLDFESEIISRWYMSLKNTQFTIDHFLQLLKERNKQWKSPFSKWFNKKSEFDFYDVFMESNLVKESEVLYESNTVLLVDECKTQLMVTMPKIIDAHDFVLNLVENTTIGRNVDNYWQINLPQVSKHHAKIYRKDFKWGIMDTGSTNGTFINGERLIVNEAYLLKDQDSIKIAENSYQFINESA